MSEKISNPNQNKVKNNNNKYVFLNPYQYYIDNQEHILNYIKDLYIKSGIRYSDMYIPKEKTKIISLDTIIRSINKNADIPINLKEDLIYAYDNTAYRTKIKYPKEVYDQYVLDPIAQIYIDKDDKKDDKDDNLLLDDESLKRELDEIIPETSVKKTKKDKSSKDKLKSDVSKLLLKA